MQSLAPRADRNPSGRSAEEILAALQGRSGGRYFTFRYRLLTAGGAVVEESLPNVTEGIVRQNWLADIKRTASFTMRETGEIDYTSDRLQPFVRLHLDPYGPDDWVEWPQGVFLLETNDRKASAAGVVTRQVEGFDQLQVYAEDLVENRYTVAAGAVVTTAVTTLLASAIIAPARNVVPATGTLTAAKEWDPGTSKLRIINDLLGLINYESLSFDEEGVAQVVPYRKPSDRAEEYVYDEGAGGLMVPDAGQELPIAQIANKWVLVVSEPDQPPLVATYTNNDPASITSTVRRQRVITDFRTEQEATDQGILDLKAERLAFEASQIFETMTFRTGLMPLHSGNDVYRLQISALAVNALYSEMGWSMPLKHGALMEHTARRVVAV